MRQQIYGYIVDDIIAKIKNGTLRPDEQLKTERNLCNIYHASQSTIKKALKQLVNLGYIYSVERVGNYVCPPNTNEYFFNFDQIIKDTTFTSEELSHSIMSQNESNINQSHDTKAVIFIRKFFSSKTLIIYKKKYVYFSRGLFSKIENMKDEEIFQILIQIDKFSVKSILEIESLIVDEMLAKELSVKPFIPMFCVKKSDFDKYEKLISYTISYYNFDTLKINGASGN